MAEGNKRIFSGAFLKSTVILFFLISNILSHSQNAIITGLISNNLSGNSVAGAEISTGTFNTYSITGGMYTLNCTSGAVVISCSKAGFVQFISTPLVIAPGSTTVLNIQLPELTNPPGPALAYIDSTIIPLGITVNWELPSGPYELLYDDGTQENLAIWAVQGNMNAMKFSPIDFPVKVTGGKINIGSASSYPLGSNPLVPFQLCIYNENSGSPGSLIAGPFNIIPASTGWINFTFSSPIIITSGNFFIVMIQGGNPPNGAGLAIDESASMLRSFSRNVTGSGPWTPAAGNFMIRANITGPGGPLPSLLSKTPSSPSSLLGYTIYRLRQGEELNPAVWSVVGYSVTNKIFDFSWMSLPCGPYRWGVKANYSGNRESVLTFTNVIGKCWTRSVTVHIDLSCPEIPVEGSQVKLTNLVYPDTVYTSVLSTDMITFPVVWKGTYEMRVSRFGFQDFYQNIYVSEDTLFNVFLLQEKSSVEDISVNDTILLAKWRKPKPVKILFSEDWLSGTFSNNGWETAGGPNWVISANLGNPSPSSMFSYSPIAANYSQTLSSRNIQGENSAILKLKYDIFLDNFGTTTLNQLAVEIWNGFNWQLLKNYSNTGGDIDWTAQEIDISIFSGSMFKIRYRAYGQDTYDINHWNIDNIKVIASEEESIAGSCVLGYNVYLDNILCNVTNDTLSYLPSSLVTYGMTHTVCVSALYASGPSVNLCKSFVSHFLDPPMDLTGFPVYDTAFLVWEKPESAGGSSPPGLKGYFIYRNLIKIDSVTNPDTLCYRDYSLFPGNYSYQVSAFYDLSYYGSTGISESGKAGPSEVNINYGTNLPFTEDWEQGNFSFNKWTTPNSQGNWIIDPVIGNSEPSATFMNEPYLTSYSNSLESTIFNTTSVTCSKIWFDVDISLIDLNATGTEFLAVEVFYNDHWHLLEQFSNTGDFGWDHQHYNISAVKQKAFRLRFRASGDNSAHLTSWLIDNVHLYAVCKPPLNPEYSTSGEAVTLTWQPPVCEDGELMNEGFENVNFPPENWDNFVTNSSATWAHTGVSFPTGVHSGSYSASVLSSYVHQDEWLIARNVLVDGNLIFWSLAYQGSVHPDHYYVKVTENNGLNWQILLDMSALPAYPSPNGYNQWNTPYVIDLSAYQGQVVDFAWHAVDTDGQGLWYAWSIDDCIVGSDKLILEPGSSEGYNVFRKNPDFGYFVKVNAAPITGEVYTDYVPEEGEYLYYIAQASDECSDYTPSDTLIVDVITGITESENPDFLLVYPNPAKDFIFIRSVSHVQEVMIFDYAGKIFFKSTSSPDQPLKVPVKNLSAGPYLLKVIFSSKIIVKKILIIKD